jgi:hypothetical protein
MGSNHRTAKKRGVFFGGRQASPCMEKKKNPWEDQPISHIRNLKDNHLKAYVPAK